MAFWSNWFVNTNNVEQPPSRLHHLEFLDGKSKVLDFKPLEWYKTNPFVYAAINERAKGVANARFYIKTEDGELIQNELTTKLNQPNQYLSRNEFLLQLMTYKGIWGTGYLYANKLRSSEPLDKVDFLNLPTDQIYFGDKLATVTTYDYLMDLLLRKKDDQLDVWYCGLKQTEKKQLDKQYLLPFFDTTIFTNPYYSESRLKSQRYVVSNIQAALESQNTFLSSPSGIGMLVPDTKDDSGMLRPLNDKQKEEVEKSLMDEYGSLSHQRNIRIVNSPVRYESTIQDVSKLKLSETLVQNGLILFGAFDLPREAFTAILQGSTFENQKTAFRNFIQTAAQIEADSIANSLDVLFPSTEGKLVADFSHMPIMQENEKEKATTLQTNVNSYSKLFADGVLNVEEYRSLIENDLKI
jgi:hypothetical protein